MHKAAQQNAVQQSVASGSDDDVPAIQRQGIADDSASTGTEKNATNSRPSPMSIQEYLKKQQGK
ncbi:hypothetical protein GCM10027018_07610 [Paenibacillus thermoaerophilus]